MLRSPLLRTLLQAVRARIPGAERDFWNRIETTGAPLVEPDPAGDPAYRLVTFLWRDDSAHSAHPAHPATDVLALLHTVTDKDRHAGDLTPHLMERLPGTDVWALGHRLRADHRASYQFYVAHGTRQDTLRTDREAWLRVLDEAVPDPLNGDPRLPARDGRSPASVMSLPDAPPQPYVNRRAKAAGKSVEAEVDGRRVTLHLPQEPPRALAVLLDGEMWGPVLRVGDTLDALHAEGAVPPTAAVLVDTMGRRMEDLSCSGDFVDWLADVLLPWAATAYDVTAPPERTLIAGQSAGGLTAAYAAHRRPDRFGRALSQSGSFWWPDENAPDGAGPEWLTRQYARTPHRPVRLHLEVGAQEWMLLAENRRLRNVLRARGYDVTYEEFNGGHDYACWRGGLAAGLAKLLGG